ncbi:MAG: FtsX-like permease family protein [Candidatus Bathyarchaeia archaeon]
MLSYAVKRVVRSLGLFAALFLGVVLASTFFAGINMGADTTAKAALLQQLNRIPVDIIVSAYNPKTSQTWATAASKAAEIDGVNVTEVISKAYSSGNLPSEEYTSFGIVGVSSNSRIYDGLTVTSGAGSLGENETYVWIGSKDRDKIDLDNTLKLNLTYWDVNEKTLSLSLKVVGFVELDEKAYSIATGELEWMMQLRIGIDANGNLLIVSWEKTFAKLLDAISSYSSPFTTQILVYLNRDKLINPWDVASSIDAIQKITTRVNDKVAGYGMSVSNNLQWALIQYQFTSMIMRLIFFVVGLPVFFVAWYVGTTVSNVSYNLRRREIGLLLTKGFSNRQLFSLFLSESIIIGVIGGLIGVGLGFLFSPIFAISVEGVTAAAVPSPDVITITVIFSLAITLLSTFRPSRRAAKLPPIEALREYTYIEEVKPYKQRLPWLALILGIYKIVIFLFGKASIAQIFAGPPFTNIFLVILYGVWVVIDGALIFIGPLLFFWGFTKIFIQGSLKFQELVTRAVKFLGDLGTLATRNVQRNPARAASIAFLIALIVGYSFQSVGLVASEQDYVIRRIKADVGADISVQLTFATNASRIVDAIENLTEVESATLEYSFSDYISFYSMQIRAVDPEKWLKTAYYEGEWFSGNDAATAFQQMKTNNKTIILERSIATYLNKRVGDSITLGIGTLTIVGFFGPEVPQQSYTIQPVQYQYYGGSFWSYIPLSLYETSHVSASSIRVLVKLKPGADGKAFASNISSFGGVSSVQSVAEKLETYQSNLMLMGPMNILLVGAVFSILAASVATALVTLVSLQERKREASIMSARGLSFKQLATIFLTENLAIIVFSVFLGVIVGLIALRGYISTLNASIPVYSLVTHRIAFPPDATRLLSTCVILIFASAIIPVILLIKRYISKMERIVRL